MEPEQKPGRSKQDYGTPRDFIDACEVRFGRIVCDLAASEHNTKCATYYDKARDSLSVPWAEEHPTGVLWLNPESRLSWAFGDSAMRAYEPHCDRVEVVQNLDSLRRVVDALVL